jgi:hypothetical protein
MTAGDVPRATVAKILNHVEVGVTKVYDRYSCDAERGRCSRGGMPDLPRSSTATSGGLRCYRSSSADAGRAPGGPSTRRRPPWRSCISKIVQRLSALIL